jgi:uncharacterized repeat protein (TIGR03847 family)
VEEIVPRIIYRHEPATRFIVSAIGDPGQRQFFIQVKSADGLNSVTLEKSQVIALTEKFEELIRELRRGKLAAPELISASPEVDNQPMDLPIDEDFQVGVISITWEHEQVVVNIQAVSQDDDLVLDDIDTGPDLLIATLNIAQVKGFCERAMSIVNAGRAACPLCGLPIDPLGHLCPRANGYRR